MAEDKKTIKWYYRPSWVVVGILAAGPFALPLIWFSPALKRWHKVLLTVAMALFTVWLIKATADIAKSLMKQAADLKDLTR